MWSTLDQMAATTSSVSVRAATKRVSCSGLSLAGAGSVARSTGSGYELKGTKSFISLADQADLFVTLAFAERAGEKVGPTMLLVDRSIPGFATGS